MAALELIEAGAGIGGADISAVLTRDGAPAGARAFAWSDSRFSVAPSTRVLRLAERAALFCGRTQQLFELNATAELIWRRLAEGVAPRRIAEELARLGAEAGEASRFVEDSVTAWLAQGRLAPESVLARLAAPADLSLPLAIGDLSCIVDLYAVRAHPLYEWLPAAFGQFRSEPDGGPILSLVADEGGGFLFLDGEPLGAFPAERLTPEVKARLTDLLSRSARDGAFLLHAAWLTAGDRGLLLTGSPGAGKSTLAVALARNGFGFGADDVVRVSPEAELSGVAFSPALKTGAWPLLAAYVPETAALPTHRRGDGQSVRYLPAGALPPAEPARLRWAVRLDRRPGASPRLEAIPALEMLAELLAGGFAGDHRLDPATLEAFAAQLGAARCGRLVYDGLGEAVAVLRGLAGE